MMDIYAVCIRRNTEKIDYEPLLPYVSDSRKRAAVRYAHSVDALRTVLGEALARVAICRRLQVVNKRLVFGKNPFGRPLLLEPDGYDFNVSHAGDWVVCAFADQGVGIDVEQIRPLDLTIAQRYFAPGEYAALLDKPTDAEQLQYFFQVWTLKESYVKAIGEGLSIPLDAFEVAAGKRLADDTAMAELKSGQPHAYFYQSFLDDAHILSLCMFAFEKPQITMLDFADFVMLARDTLRV